MEIIGKIYNDYTEKFGIPRQSGLSKEMISTIVMEKPYRTKEAFRGIEEYDYLWLLWEFSENKDKGWSPTVRPPKLGGNIHMGVFATRSPFRPNPIGLSCVRLVSFEADTENGPVLHVSGADLMNGTPLYDIKPYLAYTDSKDGAKGGFTDNLSVKSLKIVEEIALPEDMSDVQKAALREILREDPRPGYHHDEERVYGMAYGKWNIQFRVTQDRVILVGITEKK